MTPGKCNGRLQRRWDLDCHLGAPTRIPAKDCKAIACGSQFGMRGSADWPNSITVVSLMVAPFWSGIYGIMATQRTGHKA